MSTQPSEPAAQTHVVIAHNDAEDSGNPMHVDAAAQALNFKAALVPGVTIFGYMTHSLLEELGPAWLERGVMQVRFRRPVYAGETLRIETTPSTTPARKALDIAVLNPDGERCVLGCGDLRTSASADADLCARVPFGPVPARRRLPMTRRPAKAANFRRQALLGTLKVHFPAAQADTFLDAMQDHHNIYRGGVVHPAWLLRQANLVIDRNFALGPWIHVESELHTFNTLKWDEMLQVRAAVLNVFEKNGHDYVDFDVAMLIDGDPERPVMRVMHRAIVNMAVAH